jgi:hypothetical protein
MADPQKMSWGEHLHPKEIFLQIFVDDIVSLVGTNKPMKLSGSATYTQETIVGN